MKLFLDDIRNPPDGEDWIVVRNYEDCIAILNTGRVTDLSLDHDLGETKYSGYDVATYIEFKVWTEGFYPPKITVHSANPVGRRNIEAAIKSIERGNTFHR